MKLFNKDTSSKIVDEKSKSFIQNATDTFREVAFIFIVALLLGGASYSFFEHKALLDGILWALTTGFTIGYNDTIPTTVGGDVTARVLMTFSVYVIVPLITALMTFKMFKGQMVELLTANRRLIAELDDRQSQKQSAVSTTKVTKSKAKPAKVK